MFTMKISFHLLTAIPVNNWFLSTLRISFITKRDFEKTLKDNAYQRKLLVVPG